MSEPSVVVITPDRLDEVVEVLAESFFNYPTMRYVLRGSGASYPERLRAVVTHLARARSSAASPILGVEVKEPDMLAATALVDPPGASKPDLAPLEEVIGRDAIERFRVFESTINPLEPDHDFYYLGMVGVLSSYRGRGFSSLLMDRVFELSVRDSSSKGVLLTTEHDANVPIYESMGFRVLGDVLVPDHRLRSWTMFRADAERFRR